LKYLLKIAKNCIIFFDKLSSKIITACSFKAAGCYYFMRVSVDDNEYVTNDGIFPLMVYPAKYHTVLLLPDYDVTYAEY